MTVVRNDNMSGFGKDDIRLYSIIETSRGRNRHRSSGKRSVFQNKRWNSRFEISVIAVLKHDVFLEFVIKQLIASAVVTIDGEYQLGFSVAVVVPGIDKPNP